MQDMDALLGAAQAFDLDTLRQTTTAAASNVLRAKGQGGASLVHGIVASLFFFKAGDISSLVPWPNSSRTMYVHDVRSTLERAVAPILRTLLTREPSLASSVDAHGVTPMHIAARLCTEELVEELLRAGGSPVVPTRGALRTPFDEAMQCGCVEVLRLMLRALSSDPTALRDATARLAEYASLPGAALTPAVLEGLLPGRRHAQRRHASRARATLDPAPREPAAPCEEGGGWSVQPPPSEDERAACEIDQLSHVDAARYEAEFYRLARPLLVRGAMALKDRCPYARLAPTMAAAGSTTMQCGRTAYPSLTGQRHCGTFSYLKLNEHPSCTDAERTLPVCVSRPRRGVNASEGFKHLPLPYRFQDHLPPNPLLSRAWATGGSRQLFAGGRGSGAALHFHNAAYNVQLFGVKKWLLTPPRHAGITGAASTQWTPEQHATRRLPGELPLKCTQGPGDMLLLPPHWGHATINDGFAIGIGNLYCDAVLANYTHDPACHRFYASGPAAKRLEGVRKEQMQRIVKAALGGSFAPDGAYQWPPPRVDTAAAEAAVAVALSRGEKPSGGGGRTHARLSESPRLAHRRLDTSHANRSTSPLAMRTVPAPAGCARGQPAFGDVAFVHINKAGGTQMRANLFRLARHQLLEIRDGPAAMNRMRALGSRFFHASASLQRQAIGASAWDGAFTFALVRNPFARQVSMFHFLLQEASCNRPAGARPPHCEERKLPSPGEWLKDHAQVVTKFRTWIREMAAVYPAGSPSAHLFGSRSHGNERDPWFNASQLSWLVDARGALLVKRVIKLEELEAAWPALQKEICGFQSTTYREAADVKRNPSSHAHYSTYYDDATRKITAAYVKADLDAFGYAFETETTKH